MTDELEPRIEAAAAEPANAAARLVLAAALEAAGDPLGRFARVETERRADDHRHGRREPPPPRPVRGALGHGAALERWHALAPELAFVPASRLGLVGGMIGRARLLWSDLARAEVWWRHAPIQHLDLDGPRAPGDLERLLELPVVAQLESLSLAGAQLGDREARLLAATELPVLRWLDLENNDIGRDGMDAMVAGARWPRLVIAQLRYNRATATEVALYEHDLGANATAWSRGDHGAVDELGNTPADYVQEIDVSSDAESLAARYGRRPWMRVLWRTRREVPERTCVWRDLRDATLDGENCSDAVFLSAELAAVRAPRSTWRAGNLALSQLEDCDFSEANLTWANFTSTAVARCRFRAAVLPTAVFAAARITDCDFSGADLRGVVFGNAEIADTSFRGARLGAFDKILHASRTYGTRFVRCDFRGADVGGRELDTTRFIDCAFAGSTGVPNWRGPVEIEHPDFSGAGDRSDVRSADALAQLWRRP
jgi:uncharacterized protein YjbI with pentapeptide repeats